MNNEELIKIVKGVIDTNVGGLVSTQQLKQFITTIVDKSAFLKTIRVETDIPVTRDLDTLGIASRVLRKKIENTAPDPTSVTRGVRSLTPHKVILYAQLTYDWLQKAIGGTPDLNPDVANAAEKAVYDLLAIQFGNDLVDLGVNGEDISADPFLGIMNGYITKAKADGDAHTETYGADDKLADVFDLALTTMPDNFKVDQAKLKYYVSPSNAQKYKKDLATKNTALGDLMMVKNEPIYYSGIEIVSLFAMPSTEVLLTMPENLAIGFGQKMLIERAKDIKAQHIDLVVSADVDYNYVVSDALVLFTQEA